MTTPSSSQLYCNFCFTNFKITKQYNEHIVSCEFMRDRAVERNKSLQLIDDRIPDNRMMFESIKSCMFRIQQLETENKELLKFVQRERKKIDTIEYLKTRYPFLTMDFTLMCDKLKDVKEKHLEVVFAGNIVDGVSSLLGDLIDESKPDGCFPICAFSHKPNTFFIYNLQQWTEILTTDLNNLFDLLSNRFLGAYSKWERKYDGTNETEDFKQQKLVLMKRILGTYLNDEFKYKRFKSFLFEKLKQNVKNIIEYEFV